MEQQIELSTTSILSLFETDKEQRKSFVWGVVQALENGQVDPLKVHLHVKCMEKIIEGLTSTDEKKNKDTAAAAKRYRELVVEAAEKFGTKEFEFMNAKVKIGETGTKYDYSQCGDPELAEWAKQHKELSDKIKARQELLQKVSEKGMPMIYENTGEVFTAYPAAKSSTTNVIITLK